MSTRRQSEVSDLFRAADPATEVLEAVTSEPATQPLRRAARPVGRQLLQVWGVSMEFGGLRALTDVSFALAEGEIVGLIGPNGAGKTTLFNCLTGLYAPTAGRVELHGTPLPPDPARVTERGVARTFQNIRLFPSMTAEENVLVGRHVRMRQGVLSSLVHGPRFRRSEAEAAGARGSSWRSSGSPGRRTPPPGPCPTATSAGWRSRGRSPPTRRCCCSTNPPRG